MVAAITNQVTTINNFSGVFCMLHADSDKVVNLEYLRKLKVNNLWENAVHVIPICGHEFFTEHPVGLANTLIEFFDETC